MADDQTVDGFTVLMQVPHRDNLALSQELAGAGNDDSRYGGKLPRDALFSCAPIALPMEPVYGG